MGLGEDFLAEALNISGLESRPLLVAIAGPNGAGKTTFFHSHLASFGGKFVNADDLAQELSLTPYEAMKLTDFIRQQLIVQKQSFAFETVFSDPVGDKLRFLQEAEESGYHVILCFIGLSSAAQSLERVAMRVSRGGHSVPQAKLRARYPRTLRNLQRALPEIPRVLIFDQSDLTRPYHLLAVFDKGKPVFTTSQVPAWLRKVLDSAMGN